MGVDAEMFVKVRPPLSDRQVQRLAYELGAAFGPERFWVVREHGWHSLEAISKYEQDGPTIRPKAGEQFIRVRLGTRYYGEGYERGDLPTILMVAEWLEHRIPQEKGHPSAEVWYGGDSSGICAKRFDAEARLRLFRYFVKNGHEPYRSYGGDDGTLSRHCSFCNEPMRRTMWGGGDERGGFSCDGCGLYEVTKDHGRTWAAEKQC